MMLSSDHGGHEYNHGDWIDDDILVPFYIRGKHVAEITKFHLARVIFVNVIEEYLSSALRITSNDC